MATEIQVTATTSASSSMEELRAAYHADICQALSNYVASGKQLHFVSSGDEQGRLVLTFTIQDDAALNDAVSQAMTTGVGRRWTVLP